MSQALKDVEGLHNIPAFIDRITEEEYQYTTDKLEVMQINVGKTQNQEGCHPIKADKHRREARGHPFHETEFGQTGSKRNNDTKPNHRIPGSLVT